MGDICKDITGQKFGILTVVERAGRSKSGNALWFCKCDCGSTTIIPSSKLRNGHTSSCGCQKNKFKPGNKASEGTENHLTHGGSNTRLYGIYSGIKARCHNPHRPAYKNYGGRGITICEEWNKSFEAFRDWALANGYRGDLTIDRKDNNGNYEPGNCQWIPKAEQSANRRPYKEWGRLCAL